MRTPRCIATPTADTRCPRAATAQGGLYTCHVHRVSRALLDLYNTEAARRLLAHGEWETLDEGQALIDGMCREGAA